MNSVDTAVHDYITYYNYLLTILCVILLIHFFCVKESQRRMRGAIVINEV